MTARQHVVGHSQAAANARLNFTYIVCIILLLFLKYTQLFEYVYVYKSFNYLMPNRLHLTFYGNGHLLMVIVQKFDVFKNLRLKICLAYL